MQHVQRALRHKTRTDTAKKPEAGPENLEWVRGNLLGQTPMCFSAMY